MFCMKCGAKNEDGAMYCGECGTSLQQIPNPQQAEPGQQAPMQPQGYCRNAGQMQQVAPMSAAAIISFTIGLLMILLMLLSLNNRDIQELNNRDDAIVFGVSNAFQAIISAVAVLLGVVADTKIKRGKAFEIIGIIFGIVGIVFFGIRASIIVAAMQMAK